jgi:hypothetical protein
MVTAFPRSAVLMLDRPDKREIRRRCRRRYKARQRRGEAVAPVPYGFSVLHMLIDLNWLQEAESADRRAVGKAIAALLDDAASHHKRGDG